MAFLNCIVDKLIPIKSISITSGISLTGWQVLLRVDLLTRCAVVLSWVPRLYYVINYSYYRVTSHSALRRLSIIFCHRLRSLGCAIALTQVLSAVYSKGCFDDCKLLGLGSGFACFVVRDGKVALTEPSVLVCGVTLMRIALILIMSYLFCSVLSSCICCKSCGAIKRNLAAMPLSQVPMISWQALKLRTLQRATSSAGRCCASRCCSWLSCCDLLNNWPRRVWFKIFCRVFGSLTVGCRLVGVCLPECGIFGCIVSPVANNLGYNTKDDGRKSIVLFTDIAFCGEQYYNPHSYSSVAGQQDR